MRDMIKFTIEEPEVPDTILQDLTEEPEGDDDS